MSDLFSNTYSGEEEVKVESREEVIQKIIEPTEEEKAALEAEKRKDEEVLAKVDRDPNDGYFYYIRKDGTVARKHRSKMRGTGGGRKRIPAEKLVEKLNLGFPKIMLNSILFNGFKKVAKASPTQGHILIPYEYVNQEFKVILIPKHDWVIKQNG